MTTPEVIEQWNLEKSLAFYKDRFADASDVTFVFTGSFDLATMKPLVEKLGDSIEPRNVRVTCFRQGRRLRR